VRATSAAAALYDFSIDFSLIQNTQTHTAARVLPHLPSYCLFLSNHISTQIRCATCHSCPWAISHDQARASSRSSGALLPLTDPHVRTHTSIRIYIHARVHCALLPLTRMYAHTHLYACICAWRLATTDRPMCRQIHLHTHSYTCTCELRLACTDRHTCIHIYIHTHSYACICAWRLATTDRTM